MNKVTRVVDYTFPALLCLLVGSIFIDTYKEDGWWGVLRWIGISILVALVVFIGFVKLMEWYLRRDRHG